MESEPVVFGTPMTGIHGRRLRLPVPQRDEGWRKRAACRGLDPAIFYPVDDEDAAEAKAVCGRCPVREPCLEHALVARELLGVWGGLTERERRRLLRRRRKSA